MTEPKAPSNTSLEGYQPDPPAETATTIDAFFEAIAVAFPEDDGLSDRLRLRHDDLVAAQQHRVLDEASQHNLPLTLAVLAAHRELRARLPDDELLLVLTRAFVEPMRPFVRSATRAALDEAPDPFTAMVRISKARELHAFGAGFDFQHPDDDDNRYTAEVTRCYYHDVLSANGAAHLTAIFCAFDANWIHAIDTERDGFQFERPTTIGTGGSTCPFQFRRSGRLDA